ncbi:MAG TPA: cation diffusion facilitator family transporter [Stellaceae bacterium]|nr:cation diffusion facilitator family transporter [Stellaceae bacterium]
MAAQDSSPKVIFAALGANVAIAIAKFAAAMLTGSGAMLSEAIHSAVDSGNELLLWLGLRQAARPADELHPFGHGLRLYFWVFVVAVLIFGFGAVFSAIEGVRKIGHPEPVRDIAVNYGVLAVALGFESWSWWVAFGAFREQQAAGGFFAAVRRSKDPTVFAVLFEDSAALIGLLIALVGISAAHFLDFPVADGIASLGIALVLAATALFLGIESQSLLTGEAALPEVRVSVAAIARAAPGVVALNQALTMHFGPSEVLAAISLDFDDSRSAADIEAAVAEIEYAIKSAHPEVARVFVEAKSRSTASG